MGELTPRLNCCRWHGQRGFASASHAVPPLAVKKPAHSVRSVGELSLPIIICGPIIRRAGPSWSHEGGWTGLLLADLSPWESGPCTLPEQYSRAGPAGRSEGCGWAGPECVKESWPSPSTTQGNNRITRRRPGEDSIVMVSQKLEISTQTRCNDHLQVMMCGQRGKLWDTL